MHFFGQILNALLPPACIGCGAHISSIKKPFCSICDIAIEKIPPVYHPPKNSPLQMVISPFEYGGKIAEVIIKAKHSKDPVLIDILSRFSIELLPSTISPFDMIIPVPLHLKRLRQRGFNQSCIIAKNLSRKIKIPYQRAILIRTINTPSQGKLSRTDRFENVTKCFSIASSNKNHIADRNILIVDDVFTTGATCLSCARTLLQAGAKAVSAFTICRKI